MEGAKIAQRRKKLFSFGEIIHTRRPLGCRLPGLKARDRHAPATARPRLKWRSFLSPSLLIGPITNEKPVRRRSFTCKCLQFVHRITGSGRRLASITSQFFGSFGRLFGALQFTTLSRHKAGADASSAKNNRRTDLTRHLRRDTVQILGFKSGFAKMATYAQISNYSRRPTLLFQ